ncbi:MAG: putative bifunctional diguanylate cyclase/phosphodiesterase [Stenotrophobium sp.]
MAFRLDQFTVRGRLLFMVFLMNGLLLLAATFLMARLFFVAGNYENFRQNTLQFANIASVADDLSTLQSDLGRSLRQTDPDNLENTAIPDSVSTATLDGDLRSLRVRVGLLAKNSGASSSALIAATNALADDIGVQLAKGATDPATAHAALAQLADTRFVPVWKLLLGEMRNSITAVDNAQAAISHGDIKTLQYGLVGIGLALLAGLAISYGIFDTVIRPLGDTHHTLLQVLSGNFRGVPLPQRDDEIGAIARVIEDIKARSEHAYRLAYYDTLTGLPNRLLLARNVAEMKRSLGERRTFGLILLGIDRLPAISSGFGPRFGDDVVKEVVRRLALRAGRDGQLYRYGGAVFACVLRECGSDDEIRRLGQELTQTLMEEARQPLQVDDLTIPLSASAGVALSLQKERPDDILTEAEAALFEARRQGGSATVVAVRQLSEQARHRLHLADDMRKGIAAQEFEPFYQPIIDIERGVTTGAETLVRWRRADGCIVMPADFIFVAEESDLIRGITQQVVRRACADFARWNAEGRRLVVAFNVSARLIQAGLKEIVVDALARSGLNPVSLEMEITETVLVGNQDQAGKLLTELKSLGLRISLDDFGTGYSSLGYLSRFHIDKIKIDSAFVHSLAEGDKQREIVACMIGLAQRLNIEVVAEGVETVAQMEMLRGMGCRLMQGWLFAAALPGEDFPHWADTTRAKLEDMLKRKNPVSA